uniref:C2H2-type domain-containing protein n=1 Tax=Steinernema glaseri TaxID=37863 RepID=A0A1I7ZM77_9BILA
MPQRNAQASCVTVHAVVVALPHVNRDHLSANVSEILTRPCWKSAGVVVSFDSKRQKAKNAGNARTLDWFAVLLIFPNRHSAPTRRSTYDVHQFAQMTHQQFAWGSLPPQKPPAMPPSSISPLISVNADPFAGLIKPMPQYGPVPAVAMPFVLPQAFSLPTQATIPFQAAQRLVPQATLMNMDSWKLYNDLLQWQALKELNERLSLPVVSLASSPCLSSPTSIPAHLSAQNSAQQSPALVFPSAPTPQFDAGSKDVELACSSPSNSTPSPSISLPLSIPTSVAVGQYRSILPRPGPSPYPAAQSSRPPSTPTESVGEPVAAVAKGPSRPSSVNTPEEEEEFVDVERIDGEDAVTSRQRISAISEFNKKIKSLRHRGNFLECCVCEQRVSNNRAEISGHVYEHAKTKFRCKYCGIEYGLKEKVFEHIRATHPNKNIGAVEDRRDMRVVCELLTQCFPRNPKPKATLFDDMTSELFKVLSDRNERDVSCDVCNEQVEVSRMSLKKHISHNHINYRCKRCKFTCTDIKTQEAHCVAEHEVKQPENTVDFNACGAKEVLSGMMRQCFGKYMAVRP